MSCTTSSFTYAYIENLYTYNENITMSGSINEPEYSATMDLCSLCWNSGWCSGCCNYWGWSGPGFCGKNKGWSWCDCSPQTIEYIPPFTMSISGIVPLTIEGQAGLTFSAKNPAAPVNGYISSSVVCNPFTIDVTVNGETLQIQTNKIYTLTVNNGNFSVSMPLGTFSYSDESEGLNAKFDFTLVFCLTTGTFVALDTTCTIKYYGYTEVFQINCTIEDIGAGD